MPHNETTAPQGEASAQLPLAARTAPVALHLRTLDQQLADYGIREMWMRERTKLRHLMSPPALMNIERYTLGRELNAIDELYDADTDHYLRAWTAAATEQARRMGLTDTVPALVSTLPTECFDDTDLEPIYDQAFAVTPLPGCGYIPQTFPHRIPDGALDIDAFIAAERAAGRSYRDRVRSRVEDAGGREGSRRLVHSREDDAFRVPPDHDVGEAGAMEQVLESGRWPSGGRRERRHHHSAVAQYAPQLRQTGTRVRPEVQIVHRQRLVEGIVVERQVSDGSRYESHPPVFDRGGIALGGPPVHQRRGVHTGDMAVQYRQRQQLQRQTGPETDLEDTVTPARCQHLDHPPGHLPARLHHEVSASLTRVTRGDHEHVVHRHIVPHMITRVSTRSPKWKGGRSS